MSTIVNEPLPRKTKKRRSIAHHRLIHVHHFDNVGIVGYRFLSVREGQEDIGLETFINDLEVISRELLSNGRLVEVPKETMALLLEDHRLPVVDMVLPYRPDWTFSVSSTDSGNFLRYVPEKRSFVKKPFIKTMVTPQGTQFMIVFYDSSFSERNFGHSDQKD